VNASFLDEGALALGDDIREHWSQAVGQKLGENL
jgi:hypothetical protein